MRIDIWSRRLLLGAGLLLLGAALTARASPPNARFYRCNAQTGILCAEAHSNPGNGYYVGHDEPSLLFYSNEPGSGFNQIYRLRLPKDPPRLPKQDGSGGTWNFQLRPTFWFGMAVCDDQGDPNPGGSPNAGPNIACAPDSDSNIYTDLNPSSPHYIGRHPGTAFMEMQFYPPGWVANSGTATNWTAALNIDTFDDNQNTGQLNNAACQQAVGTEYVNFAFIQTDGVPFPAGSPSPLGPFVQMNANTLLMNGGDQLIVTLTDTRHGLKITVQDLTTRQSGFMVASAANGFAAVLWDPNGSNCAFATHNLPHDFHPAYATSSERTRVPGAAHSYNIAFSDEIGHFEYCSSVPTGFGPCASDAVDDPPSPDVDDEFCFDPSIIPPGFVQIGGCVDSDEDFDGVPYRNDTWPGSFRDPLLDAQFHAQPVIFSSPLFRDRGGNAENFSRVAFETDLPRIEFATNPPCQQAVSNPSDADPGAGCVNPPVGADFYPIYSVRFDERNGCSWQEGGPFIAGTLFNFGGTSRLEYGQLLPLTYPASNGQASIFYEDFRRVLPFNPCPTFGDDQQGNQNQQ
jgi:hypothetical protein